MTDVGFIIHQKKSVFVPTQNLIFLGNHINSQKMIVYLPQERICTLMCECEKLRNKTRASIKEVARVIGLIVASFSAVDYGQLFYRELEKGKAKALARSAGDFSAQMIITNEMYLDLDWWLQNLPTAYRTISHGNASKIIISDASTTGWGAICNNTPTGGRWSFEEMKFHINYLELLAIFYALKSFCKDDSNMHIQVRTDSTTAKFYVQNFGGIRSENCNLLAKKIWLWAMSKHIWLSATHIPGSENKADFESRHYSDNVEWMLNKNAAQNIMSLWDRPEIDMFASRLSKQLDRYVSWRADPDAEFVDAFTMNWENVYFFCFSSFQLNLETDDEAQGRSQQMYPDSSNLVDTDMVSNSYGTSYRTPIYSPSGPRVTVTARNNEETSVKPQAHSHGLSVIRRSLQGKNVSERATNIIMCSWRHGTQKQYSMYIKKWSNYCHEREINSVQPVLSDILDFLASLVESGLSYSAINSAR